ncbi:CACTA en-spm transposon protein [Cucumis melo var. makuwa]|uniref:CACTA en-spm transposon protein n=1 Tax=Cucumis melo var. makuwa TaxID=1194695 RepID=A0A5D3BX14_CUCMM|nr:CACTA en-spm transposon protein [Cucumis melo var. makuwa]TYK03660.1 CACTA en-spm transposon protein [Cucumis melo var. makuwa]
MCSITIPNSFYEAKQKLCDLDLRCETIHACKYDCVLYWKEFADLQHCPTCGKAQYKVNRNRGKKFCIRDKRVETDDVLRHPADAEGLKHFDYEFSDFAYDPRNKCMKKMNFFMSLLIPGPRSPVTLIRVEYKGVSENHMWRRSRLHDGNVEHKAPPVVMSGLQADITIILCKLERIFPPSFFSVMVHLAVHLPYETKDDIDPTIVKRLVVRHVTDDFIDDVDEHLSHASGTSTMSSFPRTNFFETDAMFLEFADDLDDLAGGSSSWVDVYIEVVKGDLQRFFVFDFNDQAMNRFIEHQMLNTFKEFQGGCHRHFKKSNHRRTMLLDRSNLAIIAADQSRFYNDSTSSLSKEGSRSTVKLDQTMQQIEEKTRNHEALVSKVERMWKLIEDMTRAQGPPHDP